MTKIGQYIGLLTIKQNFTEKYPPKKPFLGGFCQFTPYSFLCRF